ncbi:hypothetical protein AAFF_G00191930 [Aldrovandia affinis]|uniref:Uncharacterized protein n=1 Tax=Aldrovandia affinis TaxID=143900 RepID=A0AAD7VXB7_9TELE|nr:hypothetical protein AAFF_G00191930 [Aldrovandia affinis]
MTSLININSPMTFDDIMMGALEVYAKNNQACIVSPFIVVAALAHRWRAVWGCRSALAVGCGSKLPDAQAAYETANTLNAALTGGVNFMLHSCGWLEGGLVSSFEKFVMDADQLGALHKMAAGVKHEKRAGDGCGARGWPGVGTILAVRTHRRTSKTPSGALSCWITSRLRPSSDEGGRDTQALASARVTELLDAYQQPALDPKSKRRCGLMWPRKRPLCRTVLSDHK